MIKKDTLFHILACVLLGFFLGLAIYPVKHRTDAQEAAWVSIYSSCYMNASDEALKNPRIDIHKARKYCDLYAQCGSKSIKTMNDFLNSRNNYQFNYDLNQCAYKYVNKIYGE